MLITNETDLSAVLTDIESRVRRALVFAPHPDDEVFRRVGTPLAAAVAAISFVLVYGALGGDTGGLVEQREEESRGPS